jgi:hypothetical protein
MGGGHQYAAVVTTGTMPHGAGSVSVGERRADPGHRLLRLLYARPLLREQSRDKIGSSLGMSAPTGDLEQLF